MKREKINNYVRRDTNTNAHRTEEIFQNKASNTIAKMLRLLIQTHKYAHTSRKLESRPVVCWPQWVTIKSNVLQPPKRARKKGKMENNQPALSCFA